jgi:hypothetical protein
MKELVTVNGEFFFKPNTEFAPQKIWPKFRCSVWNDQKWYSPAEIQRIFGSDEISPGETATIELMILKGALAESLQDSDVLHWGIPYSSMGTFKVHKSPFT